MPTLSSPFVNCVFEAKAEVGESPLWHAPSQQLFWLDVSGCKLRSFDPATKRDHSYALPDTPTALAMCGEAGFVMALSKGFALFDTTTLACTHLGKVEADQPNNRFNDGRCDSRGRFFAGTMDRKNWQAPAGHLFCLDAKGHIHQHLSGLVCSNGMDFSPDGRIFYLTESFRYGVFAYDYDRDQCLLSNRRPVFQLDGKNGAFPDGLTVDADGYLWSCIVGIGEIHRYSPDGTLERVVRLPVPRGTACAFGDADLKTLYISSARETMTPQQLAEYPLSGGVFSARVEIAGQKTVLYRTDD